MTAHERTHLGSAVQKLSGSTLLVALLLASPLAAQAGASTARISTPASAEVLKAFALNAGTVQELSPPSELGRPFRFAINLDGQVRTLHLAPHKLRSCNFKLIVDDGKSLTEVEPPPENTFQGAVLDAPGSKVAASLWEGQIKAQIHMDGKTWTVQPVTDQVRNAARSTHVVYRQQDMQVPDAHCGVGGQVVQQAGGGGGPAGGALVACELAIDCDLQYYQANGSNVGQTQSAVAAVVNAMDAVYRRDVSICYTLTTTLVRTTAVYTTGPETGCSASGLLQEMTARWNANHASIVRDTAHLFSGNGTFSGTVGCANLAVICNTTSGYGVSRAISSNFATNVALVSHEIGHNWSANHCNATPPCYIMCAGIGSCTSAELKFGPTEQSEIGAHRNSRTCLGACGGCSNEASYSYFGVGCAGSGTGSGAGCVQANWATNLDGSGYGGTDWFAIEGNTGSSAKEITGLQFYCAASPAMNVTVRLYARAASGGPGAVLGTATMSVGVANGAYSVTFPTPIVLGPNTTFYAAFQNPASGFFSAPFMTSGADVPSYFGGNPSWFQLNPTEKWNFRINCKASNASPLLFNASLPQLNGIMKVDLSQARPNSTAVLVHATGTSAFEMSSVGAPSCWLYFANPFFNQPSVTDASGRASFSLPIPNLPTICGFQFYNQIAVNDAAANVLQITSTRRGEPVIGN